MSTHKNIPQLAQSLVEKWLTEQELFQKKRLFIIVAPSSFHVVQPTPFG